MFDNRDQKSANIGHFWMHLLATNDDVVRTFLSNFLDVNQFTVDSSRNTTENEQKTLCFFPCSTLYIWLNIDSSRCHLISSVFSICIQLHVHVVFFLYKVTVP